MGKAGHNAGFPLFSKPAGGKITRHLRKTTKDLEKITKHLGKTTRHLVFRRCYLGILPVAGGVTKKATKPLLNIIYIYNGSGTARPLPLPCIRPRVAPVSVGEDKNRKNPLQRMGLRPAVRLPLWSYKSKLLTPKPKARQHLLTEGIHPLQGDKQKKHSMGRGTW